MIEREGSERGGPRVFMKEEKKEIPPPNRGRKELVWVWFRALGRASLVYLDRIGPKWFKWASLARANAGR